MEGDAMLRRLVRVLLCVALAATVPVVAMIPPASAATSGVMTAEWVAGDTVGTEATASVNVTTNQGGATFQRALATRVSVTPPTGSLFQPGVTYTAGTRSDTVAAISTYGFFTCLAGWTGSIAVDAATYDETGTLTSLSASYHAVCALSGSQVGTVDGYLRLADDTPYPAVVEVSPPDTVALGSSRVTDVTLTAAGTAPVTFGDASVTGVPDYTVTTNACSGQTLQPGQSCAVSVNFAPTALSPSVRRARLTVSTPGRLGGSVSAPLRSSVVAQPTPPTGLTVFPTADTLGVAWKSGSGDTYHLQRRFDPDDPWTDVATITDPTDGSDAIWIDHDIEPGQSAQYRVDSDNAGWVSSWTETEGTRPATTTSPVATDTLSVSDGTQGGEAVLYQSSDPNTTFQLGPGGIYVDHTSGGESDDARFQVFPVAGPGVYSSNVSAPAWLQTDFGLSCSNPESILRVRQVVFAEDLTPVVLDASWTAWCPDGTRAEVEARIGVAEDPAPVVTDPGSVQATTFGNTPVAQQVTLHNPGPGTVDVGAAEIAGEATTSWTVTNDDCASVVLAPGDSCTVVTSFATSDGGSLPAQLEVPLTDDYGDLAPVVVPLLGTGATVPAAPYNLADAPFLVGDALSWLAPDDGGLPIDHYEIGRRVSGASAWVVIGSTSALSYFDRRAGGLDDYAVRAVNAVGAGPWRTLSEVPLGTEGVVASETSTVGTAHDLALLSGRAVVQAKVSMTALSGFDYVDPAASPGGTRLVFARSTSPGNGADGEYDLYTSRVMDLFGATPTDPVQLTSLPGAEIDPAFSPDGATIAFTHLVDGVSSVWTVPAAGGDPVQIVDNAADPAWTADGAALVVEDTSGAGQPLLTVPLDGSAAAPIAGTDGGLDPAIRQNGDLAYVDSAGRLVDVPADGTAPTVRALSGEAFSMPAFSSGGHLFAVVTNGSGFQDPYSVDTQSFVAGASEHLSGATPVLRDYWDPEVGIESLGTQQSRGSQSVVFSASDRDDNGDGTPSSELRTECRLDSNTWSACSSPHRVTGLSDGSHTLRVRAVDEAGNIGTASVTFVSDRTPPSVAFTRPSWKTGLALGPLGRANFAWRGTDPNSRVEYTNIAWRTSQLTKKSSWHHEHWHTPQSWHTYLSPGTEACLSVSSVNQVGLSSSSRQRCITRPWDDVALLVGGIWLDRPAKAAYGHSYSYTTVAGSWIGSSVAKVHRIVVLADTCRGCGSVRVMVGKHHVTTLHLSSTRPRFAVPFQINLKRAYTAGTRLIATSAKQVRIDGLAVARY